MGSLSDFAKSMEIAAQAIDGNVEKAIKDVAKNVGTMVIYSTPIDTSRARLNWQTTLDQPATSKLLQYPEKPTDPSVGTASALENLRATVDKYTIGKTVFITNNIEYIQKLNDGSSSQAPANFVAKATMAALHSTSTIKILS